MTRLSVIFVRGTSAGFNYPYIPLGRRATPLSIHELSTPLIISIIIQTTLTKLTDPSVDMLNFVFETIKNTTHTGGAKFLEIPIMLLELRTTPASIVLRYTYVSRSEFPSNAVRQHASVITLSTM